MAARTGKFIGLDVATLKTMLAQSVAARAAILTAHQSYAIAGRSVNRAQLDAVDDDISETIFALQLATGAVVTTTYADMSCQ